MNSLITYRKVQKLLQTLLCNNKCCYHEDYTACCEVIRHPCMCTQLLPLKWKTNHKAFCGFLVSYSVSYYGNQSGWYGHTTYKTTMEVDYTSLILTVQCPEAMYIHTWLPSRVLQFLQAYMLVTQSCYFFQLFYAIINSDGYTKQWISFSYYILPASFISVISVSH